MGKNSTESIEQTALALREGVTSLLDQKQEKQLEEPLLVIQPDQHGPLAGAKILFSPHRAEIDHMLFVQGMNYQAVANACLERFGLKISRHSVANYAAKHRDSGLRDALAVPAIVQETQLQESFRETQTIVRALKHEAMEMIRRKQFSMQDIVKVMDLELKHFKPDIMAALIENEERYRKALAAIMTAITKHANQETRDAIQAELLANQDFLSAMQAEGVPVDR